jgi:hypothetical protein
MRCKLEEKGHPSFLPSPRSCERVSERVGGLPARRLIADSVLPCHHSNPQESPIYTQCPTTCITKHKPLIPPLHSGPCSPTRKRRAQPNLFLLSFPFHCLKDHPHSHKGNVESCEIRFLDGGYLVPHEANFLPASAILEISRLIVPGP